MLAEIGTDSERASVEVGYTRQRGRADPDRRARGYAGQQTGVAGVEEARLPQRLVPLDLGQAEVDAGG